MMNISLRRVSPFLLAVFWLACLAVANPGSALATTFIVESHIRSLVPDEHGGAFLVIRKINEEGVFVQHLDSSGEFTWEGSGTAVPTSYSHLTIACDGFGGVVVVWDGTLKGIQGLYAQRIDPGGHTVWDSGGVLLHTRAGGKSPGGV